MSGTLTYSQLPAATQPGRAPQRPKSALRRFLRSMPWTGPSAVLIALVIVVPVAIMVKTSFTSIDTAGVAHGWAGFANYTKLFAEPALGQVAGNTLAWVVAVVAGSMIIALGLAQFLNKQFHGRRFVRWALIVPWAAALVMSATVWRFIYQDTNGILNRVLMDLHLLRTPIGWYQDPRYAFGSVIVAGIIVTIPFTTYVILAGLQTVPEDVHEAAKVDGAGAFRSYWSITFPLLRPALVIATILVLVSVFNSFPVIWVISGSITGNGSDTTITFAYKIAFRQQLDTGEAAALSVLNVVFLCIVIAAYFRALERRGGSGWFGRAVERMLAPVTERLAARRLARRVTRAPRNGLSAGLRLWRGIRPVAMPVLGALIGLFFVAPYLVMLVSSFKSDADLFASPATYFPSHWEWSNWVDVWSKVNLLTYIKNSLIIAVFSTALVLVVSVPAAYYTARFRFAGRALFMRLVLVTQVIAPVAVVVGLYQEFIWVHGVAHYWSMILTNAAFNLAFSIWILSGQFASVPEDIEEAATLDGLGAFATMWRIALPLVRPGLVTATIFSFIQVWNEFPMSLTLFNNPTKGLQTLPVGIQQFVGLQQTEYQYLFVASLIAIVPVVVLFAAVERHLVGGLTAGAVK
jgi:multiple sugar transport system permease protein